MNDMTPWRQYVLNKMYPDDRTKVWTETKAAVAAHNRAMGYPHDRIYTNTDAFKNFKDILPKSGDKK